MGFNDLKTTIVNQRVQQLEVTSDGIVISSDNALFNISEESKLSELHPFFEALTLLLPAIKDTTTFPCVNVTIGEIDKILDIAIFTNSKHTYILFFDFTEHYEAAHPLVQDKNVASIAKNKLDFQKRLLEAKEEFKNNFLANINHEIRNPLNSMLGFIDLLTETKLSYDQQETIKVIQKTGRHIKVLMDDMLDISKIERGVLEKKHVNFHLGAILSSLQNHFALKYDSDEVTLEITTQANMLKTFIGDPIRLNQVLFNLIENAFRNTKKGTVHLNVSIDSVVENKSIMLFELSDPGKGIPKEAIDQIFDAYYQLKLDKEKPIGEGLGLRIVKDLVDLLEGNISIESEVGKGTTFSCKLPFENRVPKKEKKTIQKGSGIFQSKRILIVEDDSTNQMLFMKTFLNNEKGYVIEIASDANHAMELLGSRKYNLIISKATLPDSDGCEFITTVDQHMNSDIASLPIIVASGNTMPHQKAEFLDAGATSFLSKPYSKKELFKEIEKLIIR